ncbi:hypothetical protein JB92DRAFT_2784650 [Gautieria morchelliformis]|nr:hypothetical protein JB92DRAFT_2784650 [Gautieria morchelliformis]
MPHRQTSALQSTMDAALELAPKIEQQLSTFQDGYETDDTDPTVALGEPTLAPAHPAEGTHTHGLTLTRSEKLYMTDGNIVVAAEAVAFRVHMSLLTRNSETFAGMLCSLRVTDAETYDGCYVVRLSDTAEDVFALLSALYDNPQYSTQPIAHLACLLRMSKKYLVASVYLAVMEALHQHLPRTVQGWITHLGMHRPLEAKLLVLDAAYEANATLLLPSLYYALCVNTLEEIQDAKPDLPHSVLTVYAAGKAKLATELAVFISDCISGRDRARSTCDTHWRSLEAAAHNLSCNVAQLMTTDPIACLQSLVSYFDNDTGACPACRNELRADAWERSKTIWSSLPEVFGLISWDHLDKNIHWPGKRCRLQIIEGVQHG